MLTDTINKQDWGRVLMLMDQQTEVPNRGIYPLVPPLQPDLEERIQVLIPSSIRQWFLSMTLSGAPLLGG